MRYLSSFLVKPYIFDAKSANITINEGDPVSIVCNVRGKPSPDVTWEKQSSNNNLLNVNTQIKLTNATLVELFSEVKILPAKREDYGTYTCFGKNRFGETEHSITLYVQCKKLFIILFNYKFKIFNINNLRMFLCYIFTFKKVLFS